MEVFILPTVRCSLLSFIPVLCCACFQELEQRYLSWKSAALPPYSPLLLTHLILPHVVLLPINFVITNDPWLVSQSSGNQCLRHIRPLFSGILQIYSPKSDNVLKCCDFLWNSNLVYDQGSKNAGLRGFCETGCGNMQQLVQCIELSTEILESCSKNYMYQRYL